MREDWTVERDPQGGNIYRHPKGFSVFRPRSHGNYRYFLWMLTKHGKQVKVFKTAKQAMEYVSCAKSE